MGTEFADYDADGKLDLVVTNHEFESTSLFRNDGRGAFVDVTLEAGIGSPTLPFVGFGVAFLDIDNDADLDLSIVNGHVIDNTAMFRAGSTHKQRKLVFQNTNGRRFAEVSRQSGAGFARDDVGRTARWKRNHDRDRLGRIRLRKSRQRRRNTQRGEQRRCNAIQSPGHVASGQLAFRPAVLMTMVHFSVSLA